MGKKQLPEHLTIRDLAEMAKRLGCELEIRLESKEKEPKRSTA